MIVQLKHSCRLTGSDNNFNAAFGSMHFHSFACEDTANRDPTAPRRTDLSAYILSQRSRGVARNIRRGLGRQILRGVCVKLRTVQINRGFPRANASHRDSSFVAQTGICETIIYKIMFCSERPWNHDECQAPGAHLEMYQ